MKHIEPMLVDTHAHLCDPVFDNARSTVIDRACHAGIGTIVIVGETFEDAGCNIELHP